MISSFCRLRQKTLIETRGVSLILIWLRRLDPNLGSLRFRTAVVRIRLPRTEFHPYIWPFTSHHISLLLLCILYSPSSESIHWVDDPSCDKTLLQLYPPKTNSLSLSSEFVHSLISKSLTIVQIRPSAYNLIRCSHGWDDRTVIFVCWSLVETTGFFK